MVGVILVEVAVVVEKTVLEAVIVVAECRILPSMVDVFVGITAPVFTEVTAIGISK